MPSDPRISTTALPLSPGVMIYWPDTVLRTASPRAIIAAMKGLRTMRIATIIRQVFAHFQNLNLLALIHDMRYQQVARENWTSDRLLCPVAHGLANGQQVKEINVLGEFAN